MADLDTTGKKWYQRPENVLTYGVLAGAGYLVFNALDTILPMVNRVLENALYTGVLCGALALTAFVLASKDVHKLVWYGYKSAMRWVTGRFVNLDPIGIMKSYVETLHTNLNEMGKAIGALKGQARNLEAKIKEKDALHEKSMGIAAEAKRQGKGMETAMKLQMRKAGRAEELGVTFQGLLNKIRNYIAVMEKVQEAANFMVLDIEDTVESETEKRKMIQESSKAMTASRRILAAGEQREMYDLAMESVTKDYYSKLGEIEQFIDDSKSFIQEMDLTNGAVDNASLSKLDEWEKRSAALLEGGTGKTKFRVAPVDGSSEAATDQAEVDPARSKMQSSADIFANLDK